MTKELLQQAHDALITATAYVDAASAIAEVQGALKAIEQALAQPSDSEYARGFADGQKEFAEIAGGEWQTAVVDQLVIHHVYQASHDTDPRKAVNDLLCVSNDIALDPLVSSDAQALIDRGRRDAQQEQPAKTERQIRRMFCATYASDSSPYMDDGEAQDNSMHPCIDFLRDSPEQIRSKMIERAIAKHKEQPAQKPDLWKTQFLTDVMTSAGLLMYGRTDKKLAQRIADGSARWRTELYTHPAPTQPALSESQITSIAYNCNALPEVITDKTLVDFVRAIEAHCRGGAKS